MVKLNSKIVIMLALTALLFIGIASASEHNRFYWNRGIR